jgi:hypothetical protein
MASKTSFTTFLQFFYIFLSNLFLNTLLQSSLNFHVNILLLDKLVFDNVSIHSSYGP